MAEWKQQGNKSDRFVYEPGKRLQASITRTGRHGFAGWWNWSVTYFPNTKDKKSNIYPLSMTGVAKTKSKAQKASESAIQFFEESTELLLDDEWSDADEEEWNLWNVCKVCDGRGIRASIFGDNDLIQCYRCKGSGKIFSEKNERDQPCIVNETAEIPPGLRAAINGVLTYYASETGRLMEASIEAERRRVLDEVEEQE